MPSAPSIFCAPEEEKRVLPKILELALLGRVKFSSSRVLVIIDRRLALVETEELTLYGRSEPVGPQGAEDETGRLVGPPTCKCSCMLDCETAGCAAAENRCVDDDSDTGGTCDRCGRCLIDELCVIGKPSDFITFRTVEKSPSLWNFN